MHASQSLPAPNLNLKLDLKARLELGAESLILENILKWIDHYTFESCLLCSSLLIHIDYTAHPPPIRF